VPFLVRLRPNAAYLALLAVGVVVVGLGITMDGVTRVVTVACGVLFVAVLGAPVLVSTVLRVPLLAVDDSGVRLPLMGVRLEWAEVAAVRQAPGATRPVLLIVPRDTQAVLRRMRPWLRAEGRSHIARYGTPIVMAHHLADHTLDEIQSAVAHLQPASPGDLGPPATPAPPYHPPRSPESDSAPGSA
jgi:hypothetical protein